jgi:uracil-DNA glycosylase family 4
MAGEPFMDRSGKILEQILAFFGMSLDHCYRTLLVKDGVVRDVLSREEIERWLSVLQGEIRDLDPRVVIVLGSFAVEHVLSVDDGVMEVRGVARDRWGACMMPTIHPRGIAFRPSRRSLLAEDIGTALDPVPAAKRTDEVCGG